MEKNIDILIFFTLFFSSQYCIGVALGFEWKVGTIISDINIVNIFSECSITLINFPGLDINFQILNSPILLLRYFSVNKDWLIYPYELSPVKLHSSSNWLVQSQVSFKRTQVNIVWKNQTINIDYKIGFDYLNFTKSWNFHKSLKQLGCEANIYLDPENIRSNQFLYHDELQLRVLIKDPFWVYDKETIKPETIEKHYINTTPKYSLLICDNDKSSSICQSVTSTQHWLSATLGYTERLRISEIRLIFKMSTSSKLLFIHCPYCDHCNPSKLLQFLPIPQSRLSLEQTSSLISLENASPVYIDVELLAYFSEFDKMKHKRVITRKLVLSYVKKFKLVRGDHTTYLADLHLLSHILKNQTIRVFPSMPRGSLDWKSIEVRSCSKLNPIRFHPKLRPLVLRVGGVHIAHLQDAGLVFRTDQLRFVSCHKEQAHWITQLKELLVVFDLPIWIFLVVSSSLAAKLLPYVTQHKDNLKQHKFISFGNTCYQVYAMMLEQSTNLISCNSYRAKLAFCLVFSWFPLVFITLSNLYKGDNISRLTLGPDLVPFDTFDSLVKNNFTTFSRRHLLPSLATSHSTFDVGSEFSEVDNHKEFPMVSKLWYEIIKSLQVSRWTEVSGLISTLSNKTLKFLKYSRMYPAWNRTNGPGYDENVIDILIEHMGNCNKSAMILATVDAIRLYTILDVVKKPAFFGKDVINENQKGYKFKGLIPTKYIWNSKYHFQAGLVKWWQEYFKWHIKTKTNAEQRFYANRKRNKTSSIHYVYKSGLYVLTCIPAFGLLLSIFVFLMLDLVLGKYGSKTKSFRFRFFTRTNCVRIDYQHPNCRLHFSFVAQCIQIFVCKFYNHSLTWIGKFRQKVKGLTII